MIKNYGSLSEKQLNSVINKAQKELEKKKSKQNKAVIAEIKKLASSIGMTVTLTEKTSSAVSAKKKTAAPKRQTKKVAPKYRNPSDASQTWTGRGLKPKWLKELLDQGRTLDEFTI